jgi:hypothetical protein
MTIKISSEAIAESVAAHMVYGQAEIEKLGLGGTMVVYSAKTETALSRILWKIFRGKTINLAFPE